MFRNFVCVRQADESDCGAAALATVARHYGITIGLQAMRDLAGTDRVGTNLLGLIGAAERLGFSANAVQGPYEALGAAPLPSIAHVTTAEGLGHFVVLHQVRKNSVIIADPAKGVQKLSRDAFCDMWSGYLLLMTPDETVSQSQPQGDMPGPVRRFTSLLLVHRGILLEGFVCALLMTLLGVSTSYFVQHLVDSVLVRGETRFLNALGVGMVAIVLFRTLFGAVRHYLLAYIGRKVDLSLIAAYSRHLLYLPLKFFEMRQVGEIVSRVNDAAKVREAISGAALTAFVDGVLVIVTTAVLWTCDVRLAMLATCFAPLLVVSVMLHHPSARRRSRKAMEDAARLSAHLVENISGVETIKAFNAERHRQDDTEHRLVQLVQSSFSLQRLSISMGTVGGLINGVAGISILWYGGHRVISGALTIGELMFFYTLLGYVLEPLERLATVNLQIQDALVAVDRLFQVMDVAREPHDDRKAELKQITESIELRDVSFAYGCGEMALNDVNLKIQARGTVAIVGESGCGKSTLLKLLARYYDPTEGQVLIDGIDLRDIKLSDLRDRIGLVSQDPFIFNGSIRDNIGLGTHQVDMADIVQAARAAGLEEFINGLPERYDTRIGERGANLSGGQRQRLAIARALLRNPGILVFDEATSHLDTKTERAIQESLRGILADKTVVLVAHRLSTIRDADVIYVMHDGRVVEQGTHDSLLQLDGRYTQLWRSQMETANRVHTDLDSNGSNNRVARLRTNGRTHAH